MTISNIHSNAHSRPEALDAPAFKRPRLTLKLSTLHVDPDEALDTLKSNASCFKALPLALQGDNEFILKALRVNGLCLQYLAPEIRNNPTFFNEAISNAPEAASFLDRDLLRGKNKIIENLISYDPSFFELSTDALKASKLKVIDLLSKANIYPYISEKLKSDPDVVKSALLYSIEPFKNLSEPMKHDISYLLKIMQIDITVYLLFPEEVKEIKSITHYFLECAFLAEEESKIAEPVVYYVPDTWKADYFMMLHACRFNKKKNFDLIDNQLKHNKEFILELGSDVPDLNQLPEELHKDNEFLHKLIMNAPSQLAHAPDSYYEDLSRVKEVIESYPSNFEYVPKHLAIDVLKRLSAAILEEIN